MNSFEQTNNETSFKFTLMKMGGLPKFQIELFRKKSCYFKSKEVIFSKTSIEEMIHLFKNGNPLLNVTRFEFKDVDKSVLIFLKGETTVIDNSHNVISGKREDFEFKDIDKTALLTYLEKVKL